MSTKIRSGIIMVLASCSAMIFCGIDQTCALDQLHNNMFLFVIFAGSSALFTHYVAEKIMKTSKKRVAS